MNLLFVGGRQRFLVATILGEKVGKPCRPPTIKYLKTRASVLIASYTLHLHKLSFLNPSLCLNQDFQNLRMKRTFQPIILKNDPNFMLVLVGKSW